MPEPVPSPWSPARRILLRFAAIYLLLYSFPFPLNLIPGLGRVEAFLTDLWDPVVLWAGEHVLRLAEPIVIQPTGSGDTLFEYVRLLLIVVFSVVGALLWTALDRQRTHYTRLAEWLRIGCRYYLGTMMVIYGIIKIIKSQFPFPDLVRLTGTYGESSPMGLLWTFMGYSEPYNIFAGGVEFLGGALLFFRRTTTLGALVSIGAMANVAMLNFSYDVPVKLFSMNLLFFAACLAARDLRRLVNLFLRNRVAAPANLSPPWSWIWDTGWRRWARWGVKAFLIGSNIIAIGTMAWELRHTRGDERPRDSLYGIYEVESFTKDGVEHPPLVTDTERWRLVILDRPGRLAVRKMDNSLVSFTFAPVGGPRPGATSGEIGTYKLGLRGEDADEPTEWIVSRPEEGSLTLAGELDGSAYALELRARDLDTLLLPTRGFHWVNELPFHR